MNDNLFYTIDKDTNYPCHFFNVVTNVTVLPAGTVAAQPATVLS